MIRTAVIAAMEQEIDHLVVGWTEEVLVLGGRTLVCHESGDVVAVAGGIGTKEAAWAAKTIVEKYRPEVLMSAGLAGALIRSLKVGGIVVPSVVVDAANGAEYRCDPEEDVISGGVLVSASQVAGSKLKQELVERFHGLIVDMEAAGVARAAEECGVRFRCVKAVSDEFNFSMPPFGQFIDEQGKLQKAQFARWAALRPRHWPSTLRMGLNSRRAAQALGEWLRTRVAKLPAEPIATLHREGRWKN
jgi:adenosylhomocysteine nucleosidase